MAYGKKSQKNRTINRNPWTRESQGKPFSGNLNTSMFKRTPTGILTGDRNNAGSTNPSGNFTNPMSSRFNQGIKPIANNQSSMSENRGGARRAPFLSNTGPGKKKY
tara:strand:+ start:5064 stop:5381 length:318 start_codon:yes stop_codon:yes gene_type:complete